MNAQDIHDCIERTLSCQHLQVSSEDGRHFMAVIVSEQFVGLNAVQQHQLVYRALGERMQQDIHALSIRTYTPKTWESLRAS